MQRADHLWGLDALRGIASIAVLILHVHLYFALGPPTGLYSIVSHTHLAVDVFFVMSGFVIAHSFDPRLQRGMSIVRFLWLRALRLYPMIIVGGLIGGVCLLAFALTRKDVSLPSVAAAISSALFLLPTGVLQHVKPYAFPANSVFWSLSIEVVFYVLYAASFALLSKIHVLVECTSVAFVVVIVIGLQERSLDVGYFIASFGAGYGRVAYSFLIGLLLRRCGLFKPASLRYGALALPIVAVCLLNPIPPSGLYDIIVVVGILPALVLVTANARPIAAMVRLARIGGPTFLSALCHTFPGRRGIRERRQKSLLRRSSGLRFSLRPAASLGGVCLPLLFRPAITRAIGAACGWFGA